MADGDFFRGLRFMGLFYRMAGMVAGLCLSGDMSDGDGVFRDYYKTTETQGPGLYDLLSADRHYRLVPLLFWAVGLVDVHYLSVICGGVSFLLMAALVIFRGGDLAAELHKKLHF